MAQFRAIIRGNRGEASRLGSKQSGISASINGWTVGASVDIRHENGVDVVHVYRTGGSNARTPRAHIATFTSEGEGN